MVFVKKLKFVHLDFFRQKSTKTGFLVILARKIACLVYNIIDIKKLENFHFPKGV